MEKYHLHPKSLIVLGVYQSMTQPSLVSRHLHIPMPTLSNIHRELEKNGLLTKQIDVEDRRRHIMKLTPLGSEAVNTCLTEINKFYDSKKSEITPADTEAGTKTLIVLNQCFSETYLKKQSSKKVLL